MQVPAAVAVVASPQDRVAVRVARAIGQRGSEVLFLDGPAAARLFTIRVTDGCTEVTPTMPIFVRHSAWWRIRGPSTLDERFMAGESYSTVWAAAALSPAPVINRPGPGGWVSHLTASTIRPLLAATASDPCDTVAGSPVEVHASGPDQVRLAVPGRVVWGRNADRDSGPVSELAAHVPLRARAVDSSAAYELITVVSPRAFSATTDGRTRESRLAERSVELVRLARLHFATVTWLVDDQGAEPVRLDANAGDMDLRYSWDDVESALCADLVP